MVVRESGNPAHPFERVVQALGDRVVRQTTRGVRAQCPAHEDRDPSLDVDRGDNGDVLLRCRSHGCSAESIVAAIGLSMADLFVSKNGHPRRASAGKGDKPLTRHESADSVSAMYERFMPGGRITNYDYLDAAGCHVGRVIRVDFEDGRKKEIRRARLDGDAWITKDMLAPKPLYNLRAIIASDVDELIVVVEGEKCVEKLTQFSILATTSAGGSQAPLGDTDWSPLSGRHVVVSPDNDEPGKKYGAGVIAQARAAGAKAIAVLNLDGLEEGEDVYDWIAKREAMGRSFDEIRIELTGLLAIAPEAPAQDAQAEPSAAPDAQPPPPNRQARVVLLRGDMRLPPVRWIIREVLPVGVGFLASPPNTGKSTLAVDFAQRVYHGLDWLKRRVRPGSVVYVIGEGMAGFHARREAWRRLHEVTHDPAERYFARVDRLPALSAVAGRSEVRLVLAELVQQHGHAPALIVIDTLSSCWAESEDRAEFVAPAMTELQAIAEEHSCCILLLHHERKPNEHNRGGDLASLRGSGAWAGSADCVLTLAVSLGTLTLATTKQRDAEKAAPIPLRLQRVELDPDEEGNPCSSVVVLPASDDAAGAPADDQGFAKLVDALRRLEAKAEGPITRGAVYAEAGGNRSRNVDLFAQAVAEGLFCNIGTEHRPDWRTRSGCAVPPIGGERRNDTSDPVPERPGTTAERQNDTGPDEGPAE